MVALHSALPLVLTTLLTWLLLRRVQLKPWLVIVVTLPVYFVMWFLVGIATAVIGVAFLSR